MTTSSINLSIGYHNIEGKHNNLLGCKLLGYINLINDIEILAETWSECKNCKNIKVPNYALIKVIAPQKKGGKKGRKSGGIHIYCKAHLKTHLKVIRTSNTCVWFQIDKKLFHNINVNPVVCAIYSPPINSAYYTEGTWEDLENDILDLTQMRHPFAL